MAEQKDSFMAGAAQTRGLKLSYMDGFRFGLGFLVAHLFVMVVVAGLCWLAVTTLKLH